MKKDSDTTTALKSFFSALQNNAENTAMFQERLIRIVEKAGGAIDEIKGKSISEMAEIFGAPIEHIDSLTLNQVEMYSRRWARQNRLNLNKPVISATGFSQKMGYRKVRWGNRDFEFTTRRAKIVQVLDENRDRDGMLETDIATRVCDQFDVDNFSMLHAFRSNNKTHAAWGTMIVKALTVGCAYKLADPPADVDSVT